MGFWSALAKVGTIAASLIPGVGPIATAAIGFGGGLLGNALDSKSSSSSSSSASSGLGSESQVQRLLAGAGQPNDNQITAGNYARTILNGSQEQIQSLLAPDISTVLSQYDNAQRAAQEFGPRGGGRTEKLAELPFQKVGAYGKVVQGARTGAADKLGQLGSQEAANQTSTLSTLLSSQNDANRLKYQKSKDSGDALGGLGSSLGGFLVDYLKKKKGGGSGSNPLSDTGFLAGIGTD